MRALFCCPAKRWASDLKIVYSNGESEIGYGTDLSKGMKAYVLDSLIDKCSDQVDNGVQGEQGIMVVFQ